MKNLFNPYSIEYATKTTYLMFKLINLIVFCQIIINLEFHGCNMSSRSWERWQKILRKLRKTHQTRIWNIPHVIRLRWGPWLGIKGAPPNMLSHLQARMGRGSSLCPQLREKIVEQFKNIISQSKIARNLGISTSTVHNIIKRFRESGEITARKRHGRKPRLNDCDLRSLRRHCLKNRHECVKDITKWAQENFRKPLSVNTVCHYIS